jgi:hypothetical protein
VGQPILAAAAFQAALFASHEGGSLLGTKFKTLVSNVLKRPTSMARFDGII